MTRFEETLENYVYYLQKQMNEYWKDSGFTFADPPTIEKTKGGKRFVKIFRTEYGLGNIISSKSIHTFVEKETGNVYKAASYKAPELNHVRANIYDYESLKNGVGVFGANYIVR